MSRKFEKTNYPWAVEKLKKPMGPVRRTINSLAVGSLSGSIGAAIGTAVGPEIPHTFTINLPPVIFEAQTLVPSLHFDNASIAAILGATSLAASGITYTALWLRNRNIDIAAKNKDIVQRNRRSILEYYNKNDITVPEEIAQYIPDFTPQTGRVSTNFSSK